MPNASGKAKVASVLKSTHVTDSCSLLLLSHDYSEEKAPVRSTQFCWHRSGKLRSITVRATAREELHALHASVSQHARENTCLQKGVAHLSHPFYFTFEVKVKCLDELADES